MKTLILGICLIIPALYSAQNSVTQANSFFTDDSIFEEKEEDTTINTWALDNWTKIEGGHLYGGGSLLDLVTNGSEAAGSSASGSIGLTFSSQRLFSNFYFSYGGGGDAAIENMRQFGAALMNPRNQASTFSLSFLGKLWRKGGFSVEGQLSDNDWLIDSTTIDASPLLFRLGFYLDPFEFVFEDNKINLVFDAHFTHRVVLGDFNNAERIIDNNLIRSRAFNGLDISANFYLNSVQMFVKYNWNETQELEMPGFTGSQVVIGLNVSGELLKLN